jgi:hypothetical protein
LAGPNGAGKTTAAQLVLGRVAQVSEFVNAGVIAQGLSMFSPASAALEAGRILLERLHELGDSQRILLSRQLWLHGRLRRGCAASSKADIDFTCFFSGFRQPSSRSRAYSKECERAATMLMQRRFSDGMNEGCGISLRCISP